MLQGQSRLLNTVRNGSILLFRSYHCSSANSLLSAQLLERKNSLENTLCLDVKVPLAQSIRWRTPLGIKRAKIPHKARALVLELTPEKFKYPLEGLPVTETCINAVKHKYVKKTEESPYERILARECFEEIEAGQMLVIVHLHPCNSEELFEQRVQLHRNNMKYLYYPYTRFSATALFTAY
ncbi:hypothetical protein FHG87_004246 [Trinorchestia longiramus]|nr:hypothetical protein FHG87_004246 [Trinorchestia longiramus]